jgi:hypothetical protein
MYARLLSRAASDAEAGGIVWEILRARHRDPISNTRCRRTKWRVLQPLAWLRLEPGEEMAELRLTIWPGGNETLLAKSGYHGRPVTWLA